MSKQSVKRKKDKRNGPRKRKTPRLTKSDLEALENMLRKGVYTQAQLARTFKCSENTIRYHKRRLQIQQEAKRCDTCGARYTTDQCVACIAVKHKKAAEIVIQPEEVQAAYKSDWLDELLGPVIPTDKNA